MSSEPTHKITVKIGDSLRTIQADTHDQFVEELEKAHDSLQACYDLVVAAKAVGNVAAMSDPTPSAAPSAPSVSAPPSAPDAFANATVPQCQHGPRTAKSGSSAKGPWRAWMCPAPKGDPSQCQPDWVRRGTPEWNNFPA